MSQKLIKKKIEVKVEFLKNNQTVKFFKRIPKGTNFKSKFCFLI